MEIKGSQRCDAAVATCNVQLAMCHGEVAAATWAVATNGNSMWSVRISDCRSAVHPRTTHLTCQQQLWHHGQCQWQWQLLLLLQQHLPATGGMSGEPNAAWAELQLATWRLNSRWETLPQNVASRVRCKWAYSALALLIILCHYMEADCKIDCYYLYSTKVLWISFPLSLCSSILPCVPATLHYVLYI